MLSLLFLAFMMLVASGLAYGAGYAYKETSSGPPISIFLLAISFITISSMIYGITERVHCEKFYDYVYFAENKNSITREQLTMRHFCFIQIDKKP